MTAPASGPVIGMQLDPASFRRLMADVKAFDAALARALRKRLRLAGADAVVAVRDTLKQPTPGGAGEGNDSVRADLAAATGVSILAGKRSAGVRIRTSARKLSDAHKAMLKAYNTRVWRHPNWGRADWSHQDGRPYFGAVIEQRQAAMLAAVETALIEARDTIR